MTSTSSTAQPAATDAPLLTLEDLELALPSGQLLSQPGTLHVRAQRLSCVGAAIALLEATAQPSLVRRGALQLWSKAPRALLAEGTAGYCPRELPAPPDFTVEGALLGSARLIGRGAADVEQALERTEAEGLGRRRLGELGVLERRLVGLAHGLTGNPRLVLLEDPFLDLEDDRAELMLSVLDRELEGRAWIIGSTLASPWSRRLVLGTEAALTVEGGTLLGPLPPADLVSPGTWARFDRISEQLLSGLSERGAEVRRTPSQNVVLVRRIGGLAVADAAAAAGVSLLELTPLAGC